MSAPETKNRDAQGDDCARDETGAQAAQPELTDPRDTPSDRDGITGHDRDAESAHIVESD